ncbi:unnamed protein product [Caenorhabditis nigoni]
MPIRIFSLPVKDLQYALNCMDIDELIAFSLCSKQTKNLVRSLNRKIDQLFVYVEENCISFNIKAGQSQNIRLFDSMHSVTSYISLDIFDSYINLDDISRTAVWRRQEFTQSDWIAHILGVFDSSIIELLVIMNVSISYLDTVKHLIPKFQRLVISDKCSTKLAEIAFWKLYSTAEEVEINENIFDNDDNDISKYLTLNLKSVRFEDRRNVFKLTSNDLLVLNIVNLSIGTASITDKELNRFLKLWMKSNHRFYRPKLIELFLTKGIDCVEVLKGIKCEAVKNNDKKFRLKRKDGKELMVLIKERFIDFDFV